MNAGDLIAQEAKYHTKSIVNLYQGNQFSADPRNSGDANNSKNILRGIFALYCRGSVAAGVRI